MSLSKLRHILLDNNDIILQMSSMNFLIPTLSFYRSIFWNHCSLAQFFSFKPEVLLKDKVVVFGLQMNRFGSEYKTFCKSLWIQTVKYSGTCVHVQKQPRCIIWCWCNCCLAPADLVFVGFTRVKCLIIDHNLRDDQYFIGSGWLNILSICWCFEDFSGMLTVIPSGGQIMHMSWLHTVALIHYEWEVRCACVAAYLYAN